MALRKDSFKEELHRKRCALYGPTCSGRDIIKGTTPLPELNLGDWLYFPAMGAYTTVIASRFNGFPLPPKHYIIDTKDAHLLLYRNNERP